MDLLSYVYPRKQAIHHINTTTDPTTPADQLTDKALVNIAINILEKDDKKKEEIETLKRSLSDYDPV